MRCFAPLVVLFVLAAPTLTPAHATAATDTPKLSSFVAPFALRSDDAYQVVNRLVSAAPGAAFAAGFEDGTWSVLGGPVNQLVNDVVVDAEDNVYIAGTFTAAGDVSTAPQWMVARWNGTSWESLGGANDWIFALEGAPDGTLYAAGRFTQIGGVAASRIARWNGTTWEPMGPGFNNPPEDLVVDSDGTLYVGGGMGVVGVSGPRALFAWTGSEWVVPGGGNGVNNHVYALAVDADDNLYVGGTFQSVNNVDVQSIAKWDGASWSDVGGGTQSTGAVVYALAVGPKGDVYAGGFFDEMGGQAVNNLARWDGTGWTDVAGGVTGNTSSAAGVRALMFDGAGALYVGGSFEEAGDVAARSIARLDDGVWSALGTGVTNGTVVALAVANHLPYLYAGGGFSGMGSEDGPNYFAKYEGGVTASVEAEIPEKTLALDPAFPNPFTDRAHFRFTSARTQHVRLEVFDALGRRVSTLFDGVAVGGQPVEADFTGRGLSAGTYLARLRGEGVHAVRRLVLVR